MQQQIYTNIYFKNRTIQKYFKTLNDFKNKFFKNNFIVQSGGSNLKIKYDNHEYIFEKNEDENIFILYSIDKTQETCVTSEIKTEFLFTDLNSKRQSLFGVTVIIDKELFNANISTINNFDKCIFNGDKVGTTLLKLTIKMLEKYKNKFNINIITLSDQSYKKCNNKEIDMMIMSTLTTGETWYDKN